MWHIWLAIVVAFVGYEFYALRTREDKTEPFTYWVRKTLGLNHHGVGWFLAAGFLGWLSFHFLIQQP